MALLSAIKYTVQEDSDNWTKLTKQLTNAKTKVTKTITKYITSLKEVGSKYDPSKISFGEKSFLDSQISQALIGLNEALTALETKVKEVTLFVDKTGIPPKDEEEEEAKNSIMLALDKKN